MDKKTLMIAGTITVGELAAQLDLPVTQLIGELFKNGIAATVNQRIDLETAQIIVDELGLEVELKPKVEEEAEPAVLKSDRAKSDKATTRPPIVAVMGHVDHGKTSLLDAVLDMKVASGEAGGITQHISAYQTEYQGRKITLLDTPGHEAFSALRQHGAALTDVVIIVVAADDGVKPQTIEAIKFAQQANARIIVALNKVDKPDASVDRVKQQLAERQLTPEEWGGDTVMVEVSAKTKQGVDKLLEMVLLVADLEDLKAETDGPAEGLVIESHMETGKGSVVGLLVAHGILKVGSFIVAGSAYAKVRTLLDFADRPIKEAGPATPATVTGFKTLPEFGDHFKVVDSEKIARISVAKNAADSKEDIQASAVSSTDILQLMNRRAEKQLVNVIVKADVQGSLTSVADSLKLLETPEVAPRIIKSGVGNISESDVRQANDSQAIIYGFNVTLPPEVKRDAVRDKVPIRIFKVIYELLDDAKQTMEDLLSPEVVETELGKLIIRGVFKISKDEVICGGEVTKGKIEPGVLARVKREDEILMEVEVGAVQKNHNEVKEVFEGDMCGLQIKTKGKLAMQEGDRLEFFKRELVKRTLS